MQANAMQANIHKSNEASIQDIMDKALSKMEIRMQPVKNDIANMKDEINLMKQQSKTTKASKVVTAATVPKTRVQGRRSNAAASG